MNNKNRNEAQTRLDLIDPALKDAGWSVIDESRIKVEEIAPGRLIGGGKRAASMSCDYVLVYRGGKLAALEAKQESAHVTEGLGQAKEYAQRLQTPFAFSTNGHGVYQVNMLTSEEGDVDRFPSPDELWDLTFGETEEQERIWRDRFSKVPFDNNGGQWDLRYYKHNAIAKTLDAIAKGRDRILLTMATGTGKTSVALEVAWKLFNSRWNLTDWRQGLEAGQEPKRRPRILFLADRNTLANQAFNSFGAFKDDALVRISPGEVSKKGGVPKNGSVFFTIFQTFMTGKDDEGSPKPYFGDYPKDFFDFIVVDECHRGGAKDESTWRGILEYFEPAVQLGMTATPKRDDNANTYAYFGDPVYVYSLKAGINDGFLTPFKVKQISTTLDEYEFSPDDKVVEGVVSEGKIYTEADFNSNIEIREREQKRVEIFMGDIDKCEKTLVFCATQAHALFVRDFINQINTSSDPSYCARVTADDGKIGDQHLDAFKDNEKTIPTILTTSQKLSTGVDARNVRNIVLMRPVKSMIEFKQIIGRGTRLFEGKDYFTVYDFVKAHEHFNDPEWDGDPLPPDACNKCGDSPCSCISIPSEPCPVCGISPCECEKPVCEECDEEPCACNKISKVIIKLAPGKEFEIQHTVATKFWSPDGTPMSAEEFIQSLFGQIPKLFKDEAELRKIWSQPGTRKALRDSLTERGFGAENLEAIGRMIDAENSDLFDVLAFIAFQRKPISRWDRVRGHRGLIFENYSGNAQQFLDFVLRQYVREGVDVLNEAKLTSLIELRYHSIADAVSELGQPTDIRKLFMDFQPYLFKGRPVA